MQIISKASCPLMAVTAFMPTFSKTCLRIPSWMDSSLAIKHLNGWILGEPEASLWEALHSSWLDSRTSNCKRSFFRILRGQSGILTSSICDWKLDSGLSLLTYSPIASLSLSILRMDIWTKLFIFWRQRLYILFTLLWWLPGNYWLPPTMRDFTLDLLWEKASDCRLFIS